MRIAVFVHFYVPYRNAGSETMLHAMVKALQKAGHDVAVVATVLPEAPMSYTYEDVDVLTTNVVYGRQNIQAWRPDLIITHHDNTVYTAQIARKLGIPWVFICHNDMAGVQTHLGFGPSLVVFNTEWIQKKLQKPGMNSVVIHPPVFPEEHKTSPGDKVTLVNLNANKGSGLFYSLAESMPDVEFLGVVGGHGEQIIRRDLPNVEIQEHTPDMKENVWSKTRILLMPSIYESYGMAGVEALASGIPVIAHPTPGLKESQGPFGLFVDRDDKNGYEATILQLLNDTDWNAASRLALKRSAELDPNPELARWVESIERLVENW
jgi:glycosyltransferase involved in cell wall biosynthesis